MIVVRFFAIAIVLVVLCVGSAVEGEPAPFAFVPCRPVVLGFGHHTECLQVSDEKVKYYSGDGKTGRVGDL